MRRKAKAGKEEGREGGLKSDKGERKKHSRRNLRILPIPKAGMKFPENDEIVPCLCSFLEITKTL